MFIGHERGGGVALHSYSNCRRNSISDPIKYRIARGEKKKGGNLGEKTLSLRFRILRNYAVFEYQGIFAASFHSVFLSIHLQIWGWGPVRRRKSGRTSLPSPRLSPPPSSQIQATTSAMMRLLSAGGPAELSRPAPRKCQSRPGSCSDGAQPPSPLHTWPCSTTSLRGLQRQPSHQRTGTARTAS